MIAADFHTARLSQLAFGVAFGKIPRLDLDIVGMTEVDPLSEGINIDRESTSTNGRVDVLCRRDIARGDPLYTDGRLTLHLSKLQCSRHAMMLDALSRLGFARRGTRSVRHAL